MPSQEEIEGDTKIDNQIESGTSTGADDAACWQPARVEAQLSAISYGNPLRHMDRELSAGLRERLEELLAIRTQRGRRQ